MLLEIFIPIILLVGCVGNGLSVYVFTRPAISHLSTFRFLAYLSLIDLLYLLIGLPHIIVIAHWGGYDFRDYSDLVCSLHSFLTLYLSHVSSNILAAVGIYRCVTITRLKPLQQIQLKRRATPGQDTSNMMTVAVTNQNRREDAHMNLSQNSTNGGPVGVKRRLRTLLRHAATRICRRPSLSKADVLILALMGIIFLFDCHFLVWMRLTDVSEFNEEATSVIVGSGSSSLNSVKLNESAEKTFMCYPSKRQGAYYFFYANIYVWIDLFLYSYIPFTTMMICTIIIIFRLFRINRQLSSRRRTKLRTKTEAKSTIPKKLSYRMCLKNSSKQNNPTDHPMPPLPIHVQDCSSSAENLNGNNQNSQKNNKETQTNQELILLTPKIQSNVIINQSQNADKLKVHRSATEASSISMRSSVKISVAATKFEVDKTSTLQQRNLISMAKKRSKKNSQIYKLLLTLNLFFFVLVTPLVLSNSLGLLKEIQYGIKLELVYILAYLNHCLNFLFYGLSCEIYRVILFDTFAKCFRWLK